METSIIILFVVYLYWCFVAGRFHVRARRRHRSPLSLSLVTVIVANPEAKRLYEELIKVRSYNKLIRPVKNNSEQLTVYLGLRLTQLLDVVRRTRRRCETTERCSLSLSLCVQDEKNQIMTSNVWLKQVGARRDLARSDCRRASRANRRAHREGVHA